MAPAESHGQCPSPDGDGPARRHAGRPRLPAAAGRFGRCPRRHGPGSHRPGAPAAGVEHGMVREPSLARVENGAAIYPKARTNAVVEGRSTFSPCISSCVHCVRSEKARDCEAESLSSMPALHAKTPRLIVANARHSSSYGCALPLQGAGRPEADLLRAVQWRTGALGAAALSLDPVRFDAPFGHGRKSLSLCGIGWRHHFPGHGSLTAR